MISLYISLIGLDRHSVYVISIEVSHSAPQYHRSRSHFVLLLANFCVIGSEEYLVGFEEYLESTALL